MIRVDAAEIAGIAFLGYVIGGTIEHLVVPDRWFSKPHESGDPAVQNLVERVGLAIAGYVIVFAIISGIQAVS